MVVGPLQLGVCNGTHLHHCPESPPLRCARCLFATDSVLVTRGGRLPAAEHPIPSFLSTAAKGNHPPPSKITLESSPSYLCLQDVYEDELQVQTETTCLIATDYGFGTKSSFVRIIYWTPFSRGGNASPLGL